jgi:hypothetical protein
MAPHKGRGIMFGGVFDKEESEEDLSSIFYNDLYLPYTKINIDMRIKSRVIATSNSNFAPLEQPKRNLSCRNKKPIVRRMN